MFTVYVLKSLKNNKKYIGQTSKDILERLSEHNKGCNKWTKQNRPFKVIYTEECNSRTEARKRENFLKSGQGRKWLDKKLNKT